MSASQDLQADAAVDRDDTQSGVMATRGAGMPIAPIHRADAGVLDAATASRPDAQRTDAASVVADASAVSMVVDAQVAEPPPDAAAIDAAAPAPEPPLPEPTHRYAFSGVGNAVPDEQGGKGASIQGSAMLDGTGAVTFRADGGGVVELPSDVLGQSTSFTALVWLTVSSDACWQRALELSYTRSVNGNGNGNSGDAERVSLFVTPYGCPDALPALGYKNSSSTYQLSGRKKLDPGQLMQLGLSFSARSRALRLVVNGEVENEQPVPVDTRELQRATVWLGRSHYEATPALAGSITEVRIYESALDHQALRNLYQHGPDL